MNLPRDSDGIGATATLLEDLRPPTFGSMVTLVGLALPATFATPAGV